MIPNLNREHRFNAVGELLAEWRPDALVVGLPMHPDGTPHEMTQQAKRFGNQLNGRFGLPVTWVDERYSSVEAEAWSSLKKELTCITIAVLPDSSASPWSAKVAVLMSELNRPSSISFL